jgi:GrpB-like predicted nucleotidyltransferase (UPF0157 family)
MQRALAIRDTLPSDPARARCCGDLKARLAAEHPADRQACARAKADFVWGGDAGTLAA